MGSLKGMLVADIRGVLSGWPAQCSALYLCHPRSPHAHPLRWHCSHPPFTGEAGFIAGNGSEGSNLALGSRGRDMCVEGVMGGG